MASPYVYERQSEYWTSRQVESFFLSAGFLVVTLPLSQILEHTVPADFIFGDPQLLKVFGFQYKALYHNGDDHWPLDSVQHSRLLQYPWIYYCLSELTSIEDQGLALHLARIVSPTAVQPPRAAPSELPARRRNGVGPYQRWGAFFRAFREYRVGRRLRSAAEFERLMSQGNQQLLTNLVGGTDSDILLADIGRRRAIHFSSFITAR